MKTLNYSRQREAIYNYLLSTKTHPTAEAVYQVVQQDYPKISLATVYRNLALLEETGQVQRIPMLRIIMMQILWSIHILFVIPATVF